MEINRRTYGRTPNDHDYCEWLDEPGSQRLVDRLERAVHRYLDELARKLTPSRVERRWGKTAPRLRDHRR